MGGRLKYLNIGHDMVEENIKVTYEVHTLKDGRWIIDQIMDDGRAAIEQAKELFSSRYFDAVKVIEERLDLNRNQNLEKIIYEAKKGQSEQAEKREYAEAIQRYVDRKKEEKRQAGLNVVHSAATAQASSGSGESAFNMATFVIILVALVMLGLSFGWLFNNGYIDLSGLGIARPGK